MNPVQPLGTRLQSLVQISSATHSSSGQHLDRSVQSLSVSESETTRLTTGESTRPVHKQDAGHEDFSDPRLPVNCVPTGSASKIDKVPKPRVSPVLQSDSWWSEQSWKPETLDSIQALLKTRQTQEAEGEEFTFAPLSVTLENMLTFIRHMRAGCQFNQPLTAEEDAALARLETQTAALVAEQTPYYKRTVRLAISLMIVCDIITHRQVLQPLANEEPEQVSSRSLYDSQRAAPPLLAALPWGGTGVAPDMAQFPSAFLNFFLKNALIDCVNDAHTLLYPTFQSLDVADFCKFSHLPVHPLGMTTEFAPGAHGCAMSPLAFMEHDLQHLYKLQFIGNPAGQKAADAKATALEFLTAAETQAEAVLNSCEQRLAWRLMLEKIPASLAARMSTPALWLMLFQLVHERSPRDTARRIGDPGVHPFITCLTQLAQARREHWHDYEGIYRQVTDSEATAAALWTASVWKHWQDAGFTLTPHQWHSFSQTFAEKDVPRLDQHLAFLLQHKGTLRQLFMDLASVTTIANGERRWCFYSDSNYDPVTEVLLFKSYDRYCGLRNLDYTDVIYFTALHSPSLRQHMENATGATLPEGMGIETDALTADAMHV